MNPALPGLNWPAEWFPYQDYLWFLVLLAWTAVAIGAWLHRSDERRMPVWVPVLAGAQIANAALELLLLAQDLEAPYTRFDFLLGACSAVTAVAPLLPWALAAALRWRLGAVLLLGAILVWWRLAEPVYAGGLGAAILALGLWSANRREAPLGRAALFAVWAATVAAAHGPLAHLWGRGRIATDISGWAVIASLALLTGGVLAARRSWETFGDDEADAPAVQRDFRRQTLWLAGWLVIGAGVIAWQGRVARRAFEDNLLHRVATAAALLDREALRDILGPKLRITERELRYYPDGRPALVLTVPHLRAPAFAAVHRQLEALHRRNADLLHIYIVVPCDGQLVAAVHSSRGTLGQVRPAEEIDHVVSFGSVAADDLAALARDEAFVRGPFDNGTWGDVFAALAPLHVDAREPARGWLQMNVNATTWLANFTQARLLGMLLVLFGVVLWGLNLAYRRRQRERTRAELRAAAATTADRLKSEFLAKVSHELRTPLQTLKGFGELLAGSSLGERERAYVRALQGQTDLMHRVVNDLVDLGAIQAGAFRLQPAALALTELLQDVATLTQPAARAQQLTFRVDWPADLPPWVLMDGVRLRQILLNLLGNALKFTARGSVSLRVECERVNSAGWIVFHVKDTGPGIPSARRAELFLPFTTLAHSSGAQAGAGLGLALSHALALAMGGTLEWVDGALGAHFRLRLPLAVCPPPAPVVPAAVPGWADLDILVVDDNTLVRELLTAFLAGHGARVSAAADGDDALARCQRQLPDVVLLDLALPGRDGLAIARELRRLPAARALRIVGLSAHAAPGDAERAREAGMDDFLAKPVSLAQLAASLAVRAPEAALAPPPADLDARLADCFRIETPVVLAELRRAVEQRDWPRARERAHYLKNSADVLRLVELQRLCRDFSTTDWSHQPERAASALQQLAASAVLPARPSFRN